LPVKFEDALRNKSEEELDQAAKEFVRCKCLILQAIKTAQGGNLDAEMQAEWDANKCEILV
jgi:hypothetical protein